jgi:hypothetical protein
LSYFSGNRWDSPGFLALLRDEPIPGERDQAVDGCDQRRWVIFESALPRLL